MQDTVTGKLEELPGLIKARCYHSSIALDKHLYAIGGRSEIGICPRIEFLDLETKQDWQELQEHDSFARMTAGVTCISPDQIVVFGGSDASQ